MSIQEQLIYILQDKHMGVEQSQTSQKRLQRMPASIFGY
jgi:hypothetical protein